MRDQTKATMSAAKNGDSEPNRLASDEKVNIAMTVARKGTRAEKHDDADDEHAEHGQKQDVSTFTMH